MYQSGRSRLATGPGAVEEAVLVFAFERQGAGRSVTGEGQLGTGHRLARQQDLPRWRRTRRTTDRIFGRIESADLLADLHARMRAGHGVAAGYAHVTGRIHLVGQLEVMQLVTLEAGVVANHFGGAFRDGIHILTTVGTLSPVM